MLKPLLIGAAGLAMLAGCASVTDYITPAQQACIINTGIAMQADEATADLRLAQRAALVANACGVSADAIIMKAAE